MWLLVTFPNQESGKDAMKKMVGRIVSRQFLCPEKMHRKSQGGNWKRKEEGLRKTGTFLRRVSRSTPTDYPEGQHTTWTHGINEHEYAEGGHKATD